MKMQVNGMITNERRARDSNPRGRIGYRPTVFKSGPSTSLTWGFVLAARLSPRIPRGLPCTVGHGWTLRGAGRAVRVRWRGCWSLG
jgi:hypothetical protein